ncbi:hypothetical protein I552_6932 [Mycobacterium xenopi 3993]|nr:hypothetical protein I552_6932 [Mycobacterium xenopi 3993]
MIMEDAGPLCLDCADLGHLEFLPSGDATLTRRAKKASRLSAVVVRWSRSRKRYERQGILAEPDAIERAEQDCLSDAEVRARRMERDQAVASPTTCGFRQHSLQPSARCFPAARSAAPKRSRAMQHCVAVAASDEARPDVP